MLVERAALVFVLALAYDVYDLTTDRLAGLDTLVRRVGASGAFHLMDVAWLVFVGAVGAGVWAGVYTTQMSAVLFVYALGARWFLRTLHRHLPAAAWHKVLIDALMPLQTVLLLSTTWLSE
jgi:4-hydroxybenzoate polyprenyltransferase